MTITHEKTLAVVLIHAIVGIAAAWAELQTLVVKSVHLSSMLCVKPGQQCTYYGHISVCCTPSIYVALIYHCSLSLLITIDERGTNKDL